MGPVRTGRWESVGRTPEESRAYSRDTDLDLGPQVSTNQTGASQFGRETEDLAGSSRHYALMELNGRQIKQLNEALLSAFSQAELAKMVSLELDWELDEIAGGGDFVDIVFRLVRQAEATGQLNELLTAFRRYRPEISLWDSAPYLVGDESLMTIAQWSNLHRTTRKAQGYIETDLESTNALPLQMVLVPGGTFKMGSPETEAGRADDEGPQHDVTVPSFFISRYPVTQAQWRAVAALPQVNRELDPDPANFKGDDHPVETVSWYDAVEFCERLTQATKCLYRLPSEAEWEYACRAGTTTPFYFGKTLTDEIANYNASVTYAEEPKGKKSKTTTPVDHFGIANAFGLSDMHGNVLEWCQDYWHDNYEKAPKDGSAWLTDNEEARRVIRGGSWGLNPRNCRSAYRDLNTPDYRYLNIGFRLCCSAPRAVL